MLQMVRTLAQFSIALEEMQESGEGTSDDGGGGGPGDETSHRSTTEPNGNGGGGGTSNPQTGAEVRASQKHACFLPVANVCVLRLCITRGF